MKPTNEEINKTIHEFMGHCFHNPMAVKQQADGYSIWKCRKCFEPLSQGFSYDEALQTANPDYCSDDSPRRLLNEVIAKLTKQSGDLYFGKLEIELYKTWRERGRPKNKLDHLADVVAADAQQIATACYYAIKEQAK